MSGSDGRLPSGFSGDPAQLARIAVQYKNYLDAQAPPQQIIDIPALHAAAIAMQATQVSQQQQQQQLQQQQQHLPAARSISQGSQGGGYLGSVPSVPPPRRGRPPLTGGSRRGGGATRGGGGGPCPDSMKGEEDSWRFVMNHHTVHLHRH